MIWSGAYLRSNFSSTLLQNLLKLVLLSAIGPKVYVVTMITVISHSYGYLVETLNHMKSLKIKDNPGENVADCCDEILVDDERLESIGSLIPITLAISFASLSILLIQDSISGKLRITRRLCILLRKCVCVMKIS